MILLTLGIIKTGPFDKLRDRFGFALRAGHFDKLNDRPCFRQAQGPKGSDKRQEILLTKQKEMAFFYYICKSDISS
jgi:hypothetical protein